MSKLSTISFGVVLVAVASSAAYTQSSPSLKGARSIAAHNTTMARAQADCTDGLEYTKLTQALGTHSLVVEAANRLDHDIAFSLANTAEQSGTSLVLGAGIDNGNPDPGFRAIQKPPANAWRLVVERVRTKGQAWPYPSLTRAALYDDKNVEQGRWQGRTLTEVYGRTCAGRPEATLWGYLQLPSARRSTYGAADKSTESGKLDLKAWAPEERLQGLSHASPAASQGCQVTQTADPAARRRVYHLEYNGKSLDVQEGQYVRSTPQSTAFLCDDSGVVAVGLAGARRFDWSGKKQRSWIYTLADPSSDSVLTLSDTSGKDALLDVKRPGQEAGYRLTLPDWKGPSSGRLGQSAGAFVHSQCQPAPDLTDVRKLAINALGSGAYRPRPLGVKDGGKSYVAVLGVKVAADPAPTAVLVDARAGASVVNLAQSPTVTYLEVLASPKHPKVLVLDAPPGLVVNVVTDSACASPLQNAADAPKLSTVYSGVSREDVSLPLAATKDFGFEAFFANRSEVLTDLEAKGLLQKLTADDVRKIMDDYAATKPIGTRLKAALWDKSALNTDLPHASTFYLVKGPVTLPGTGGHGPDGEVYFVAKGSPAPEGARGGRVLDINTYRCIQETFWCPWPGA